MTPTPTRQLPQVTVLTGGSGRLGQELQALLPGLLAPASQELNVTDAGSVSAWFHGLKERPRVIVHAAAYTDVAGGEQNRERCWQVNVEGTRHIAAAARELGARLIHISTDYVFSGDRGGYSEGDTPGPTNNFYALTKLVAEEAARAAPQHLIVRTSFRPREFQYPVAFGDVYTSQDYVDVIAPMIADVIVNCEQISVPVLHVATERKSVYELAQRRSPDVREGSRADVTVTLPADVSLDTRLWQRLSRQWENLPEEDLEED